ATAADVGSLLQRFRGDPALVDETWRAYFTELLGTEATPAAQANGGASVTAESRAPEAATTQTTAPTPAPVAQQQSAPTTTAAQPAPGAQPTPTVPVNGAPIRGAALKIVENMETSLGVPTATSNRQVPVKVLEENRLIINRHLQERGQGKVSFTHLIAFALLRAFDKFPQMNDGFAVVDGTATRLRRPQVNLGVAIDIQKKDGTRSLLVPNIKGANALTFAQFIKAYDDVIKRARGGKLGIPDFQDTTVSLTNPGTIGTVASTPRLM